jgi:flagellar biosynthesis protein FlhF
MKIYQFIAENAAQAVEQIRQQLGPRAVVLNIRQLPAEGLSRLWSKPRIEVLAGLEAPVAAPGVVPQPVPADHRLDVVDDASRIIPEAAPLPPGAPGLPGQKSLLSAADLFARQGQSATEAPVKLNGGTSGWRVPAMLRDMGLAPMHAHQLVDHLQSRHGERAPASLREEISIACSVLAEFWDRKPAPTNGSSVHVFVGPFGAGKTTVICKWLTQTTLLAGHSARVWRLDGATANTAESLSVYGEILGVPVARSLTFGEGAPPDIGFIDLPGVDWRDAAAVRELARRLTELPPAQVHLVLNAAYESSILQAQAQAFRQLPVQDIVLTHLDEEVRWGKLWNLVLGTNYRVGWLSAGQNIPGTFVAATAGEIIARQFALK